MMSITPTYLPKLDNNNEQSVGVEFEAHSVVTCAALYKAFTFCKQEMKRYLAQLEKGQVGGRTAAKRNAINGIA